jgi:hypothetical protein
MPQHLHEPKIHIQDPCESTRICQTFGMRLIVLTCVELPFGVTVKYDDNQNFKICLYYTNFIIVRSILFFSELIFISVKIIYNHPIYSIQMLLTQGLS